MMNNNYKLLAILILTLTLITMAGAAIPILHDSTLSPDPAYTDDTLLGYCNASDADNDISKIEYKTYINDVLNESSFFEAGTLFQEAADSIACTGTFSLGNCAGLDDGDYSSVNIGSSGQTTIGYFNYTDKHDSLRTGNVWTVKDKSGQHDETIPAICHDQSILQLRVDLHFSADPTSYTEGLCYNGTSWQQIYYVTGSQYSWFFEQAITWNLSVVNGSYNVVNVSNTFFDAGDEIIISCNAYDGTNYSGWVNSSILTISSGAPVINTSSILPATAYTNDTLLGYCNATDSDGDNLSYYWRWYKDGVLNSTYSCNYGLCNGEWSSNSSIVNGLSSVSAASYPTVFNDSGVWKLIGGETAGTFYGFQWNGTSWVSNSSIVSGLTSAGTFPAPTVFNDAGVLKLISGATLGDFYGFQWNGTSWVSNSSIVNGLTDLGDDSNPTVFNDDGVWKLISGEALGNFYGFQWNGTSWVSNSSIINGLGDIGSTSTAEVFNYNNVLTIITTDTIGVISSFQWNGTIWESNSFINNGMSSLGAVSHPTIFNDGGWKLINVDLLTTPDGFQLDETIYAESINSNIHNLSSSLISEGDNWTFSCRANDGISYTSWLNSSSLIISNSIPIVQTSSILPLTAYTTNVLYGYCNATDADVESLAYEFNWYLNDVLNETGNYGERDVGYKTSSFSVFGNSGRGLTTNGTYIWYSDYDTHYVYKYYMNGTYTGTNFSQTQGVVNTYITSNDTYFWLGDYSTENIYKYYKNGTYTGTSFNVGFSPYGLEYDSNGYIWIIKAFTDELYKYYVNGTYTGTMYEISAGVGGANRDGVYIENDLIYTTDGANQKVFKTNKTTGTLIENYSITTSTPMGIDSNGTHFFIYDFADKEIDVYDRVTNLYVTQGIETNLDNISSSSTSPGDNWTLECRSYDGTSYSAWTNSSQITILATPISILQLLNFDSTSYSLYNSGSLAINDHYVDNTNFTEGTGSIYLTATPSSSIDWFGYNLPEDRSYYNYICIDLKFASAYGSSKFDFVLENTAQSVIRKYAMNVTNTNFETYCFAKGSDDWSDVAWYYFEVDLDNAHTQFSVNKDDLFMSNGISSVRTVDLSPTIPYLGQTITATWTISNPDSDASTHHYKWYKNGVNVSEGISLTNSTTYSDFVINDNITIEIYANDTQGDSVKVNSSIVTIQNVSITRQINSQNSLNFTTGINTTSSYDLILTQDQNATLEYNITGVFNSSFIQSINFNESTFNITNTTSKTIQVNITSFDNPGYDEYTLLITRKSDGIQYSFNISTTITTNAAVLSVTPTTPIIETIVSDESIVKTLTVNNTGDYNASSCDMIASNGLDPSISIANGLFNLSIDEGKEIIMTISGVSAGTYTGTILLTCAQATDTGASVSSTSGIVYSITVTAAETTGGGGGGSSTIPLILSNITGFCGDGTCGAGENTNNCFQDCKINYDELITCVWKPEIPCDWKNNWFPLLLIIGLITLMGWLGYVSLTAK